MVYSFYKKYIRYMLHLNVKHKPTDRIPPENYHEANQLKNYSQEIHDVLFYIIALYNPFLSITSSMNPHEMIGLCNTISY